MNSEQIRNEIARLEARYILKRPSFQGRLMIKMRSPEYLLESDA